MANLFETEPPLRGAFMSDDRRYRYSLWRIWNIQGPLIMFIGLNPSTANETEDDNTIAQVMRISRALGFGGCHMVNCFPYISTDPKALLAENETAVNDAIIDKVAACCEDVIFAWGKFPIVRERGRDTYFAERFPQAKALILNNDGTPRHPLYVPRTVKPVPYRSTEINITTTSE